MTSSRKMILLVMLQGFLYAEQLVYLLGRIVVTKSDGQVAMVEVPDWSEDDKAEYLEDAKKKRFV